MLDKDLLKYLGKKKAYLAYIVICDIVGLLTSVFTTLCLITAIRYFIELVPINGIYALLIALGSTIINLFVSWLSSRLANSLADFVTKKVRQDTYNKFLALEGRTTFTTSEMTQLSTEGVEQLRLYYSSYIPSFFYAMIAPILLFIIFFCFFSKVVAIVYLCCVPIIPISIIAVSKWAKRIFNKYWDQYTGLGNTFLDNTRGMRELKIFKFDDKAQEKMDNESEGFRKITMKVLVMQLASITIMDLVAFGGAAIGIVLSLVEMNNGLDIYKTIFMILVGAEFFLPLRTLGSAFHVAMNGATAGKKIMKLFSLENPKVGNKVLENVNSISLENVSFGYENTLNLKNINLQFSKGLYSLVGLSGSGKSTMAKLLSRTLRPNEGVIKFNGIDIAEYTLDSFYSKVAYIAAGTYIFHQSIRDSFKFYNPNLTDDEMVDLLKRVSLDHLPLDLIIEEDATNISGGEKQRLSLALYLSKEYDFYIFDEITSNIDIESEEIILNIIKDLSKNHIVLMISHRLKSTSFADHIYYLDNGQIAVDGTYDDLLSYDNKFNELYEIQKKMEVIL